jgi:hypothetical protein
MLCYLAAVAAIFGGLILANVDIVIKVFSFFAVLLRKIFLMQKSILSEQELRRLGK